MTTLQLLFLIFIVCLCVICGATFLILAIALRNVVFLVMAGGYAMVLWYIVSANHNGNRPRN